MEKVQRMLFKCKLAKLTRKIAFIKYLKRANLVSGKECGVDGQNISGVTGNIGFGAYNPKTTVYYDCLPSVYLRCTQCELLNAAPGGHSSERLIEPLQAEQHAHEQGQASRKAADSEHALENFSIKPIAYRLKFNRDQLALFEAGMHPPSTDLTGQKSRPKRIKIERDFELMKIVNLANWSEPWDRANEPYYQIPDGIPTAHENMNTEQLVMAPHENMVDLQSEDGPPDTSIDRSLWLPVPRFAALTARNIDTNVDTTTKSKDIGVGEVEINYRSQAIPIQSLELFFEECSERSLKSAAVNQEHELKPHILNAFLNSGRGSSPPKQNLEDSCPHDNRDSESPSESQLCSVGHLYISGVTSEQDNDLHNSHASNLHDSPRNHELLNAIHASGSVSESAEEMSVPIKVWSYPKEFFNSFYMELRKL